MQKLQDVLSILASGKTIPERYRDHPLKSNWKGYRDIHIEPDWILIYRALDQHLGKDVWYKA